MSRTDVKKQRSATSSSNKTKKQEFQSAYKKATTVREFNDINPADDRAVPRSDNSSLVKHNDQYTKLLQIYVRYARSTIKTKQRYKHQFYKLITRLLWAIVIMTLLTVFYAVLLYGDKEMSQNLLTTLIAGGASLITAIIVLPQTIAKYLFNPEEEKVLSEIIKNVQKYDMCVREGKYLEDDSSK